MKKQIFMILMAGLLVLSSSQMGMINAESTFESGDDPKIFESPITPDQNDQPQGVVIIDDLHDNDYTSGSMTTIVGSLEDQGYIVKYTSDFSTFGEAVDAANYLIISAAFTDFTTTEITAVNDWFESGSRNLLMASRGDFSEPSYSSMNDLLTTIGATSRIQDDNVYTTATDVPQPWYIDSDNFNSSFTEVFDSVATMSFFSPSSINPGSGSVLINAETQAYQSNEAGDPPAVVYDDTNDGTGGDAIPLAGYEEVSNGNLNDRVVTIGTTMWSDFDYGAPDFGDTDFLNNILAYFRSETIAEAGEIVLNIEDTTSPEVDIAFPHNHAVLKGQVEIIVDAFDQFGIDTYEIAINGDVVSTLSTYDWDTTQEAEGENTVTVTVSDAAGYTDTVTFQYTIDQDFEPSLDRDPKVMTYNIKQSGVFDAWMDVMLEENADIAVLVETGDFDDNSDQLLNSVVADLNDYYFDEIPYQGYTMQNIANDFDGITILSRFDITSNDKLTSLQDDNGNNVNIPLPFLHSTVDMFGYEINLIGTHLTCCSGVSNFNQRMDQQEAMINYMDDLGDVPIIYLGDFNSLSPADVDETTGDDIENNLGTEPIEMLLDDTHPQSSEVHSFVDVAVELGTTADTFIGSIFSRIDYIFVNDFFHDMLLSSTTGDTASAQEGSDHVSVDVRLEMSQLVPETPTSQSATEPTLPISWVVILVAFVPRLISRKQE